MKNNLLRDNKAIAFLAYTIFIKTVLKFISIKFAFYTLNEFIFFILYVIIGLVIPIIMNFNSDLIALKRTKKIYFRLSLFLGIFIALFTEILAYYLEKSNYINVLANSVYDFVRLEFPFNIFVVFVYAMIIFMYFKVIYRLLVQNYNIYSVLLLAVSFAYIFDNNFLKSFVLGLFMFYFLYAFENINIMMIVFYISVFCGYLFSYTYKIYSTFGIMHYFILIYAIISFFAFRKFTQFLKKVMVNFNTIKIKTITKQDLKIICVTLIIIGVYIIIV